MHRTPLSRSAQVLPFVSFLEGIGAQTERALERHKLPPGLRERPEVFVSTHAMAAFVGDMARREGIEGFGWRAASPTLDQLTSGLARTLRRSHTLLHALQTACSLAYRESTNAQIWLAERGDSLFFCHRGSIELGAPGADDMNMMRTAIAISIVRMFTNPDWVPTQCGLAVEGDIASRVREDLRDTRILRAPDFGWLRLPRSILARPPRTRVPGQARSGTRSGNQSSLDLVDWLVELLRACCAEGVPSIHDVADLAGISVRSLQRELARAGSGFRDILQRAKLEVAMERLKQPDVQIFEVADKTGFSDPAHFHRFFRRLTGVTPQEYRAALPRV